MDAVVTQIVKEKIRSLNWLLPDEVQQLADAFSTEIKLILTRTRGDPVKVVVQDNRQNSEALLNLGILLAQMRSDRRAVKIM